MELLLYPILFLLFVYAVTRTIRHAWNAGAPPPQGATPHEPEPSARRLGKVQASLVILAIILVLIVLGVIMPA